MGIPNHFQGIRTTYFTINSKALEMVSSKHNRFQYCFCKMISVLLLLKGLFKIISNTYNLEVIFSGISTISTNSWCYFFFTLKKYISELFQHTKVALTEISSDPIWFSERCFVIHNKVIEEVLLNIFKFGVRYNFLRKHIILAWGMCNILGTV